MHVADLWVWLWSVKIRKSSALKPLAMSVLIPGSGISTGWRTHTHTHTHLQRNGHGGCNPQPAPLQAVITVDDTNPAFP